MAESNVWHYLEVEKYYFKLNFPFYNLVIVMAGTAIINQDMWERSWIRSIVCKEFKQA